MKRIALLITTLAASFALMFTATGCGASDDDCKGDAGTVTGKDYDPSRKGRSADYDVTVQRPDGSTYERDVSQTAYDWVKVGSRWPSSRHCTPDGKLKD